MSPPHGSGTLVNKLKVFKEQRKTEEGSKFEVLKMPVAVKESRMQLLEHRVRTGSRREIFGQ